MVRSIWPDREIVGKIGEGSCGAAYRARRQDPARVIPKARAFDPARRYPSAEAMRADPEALSGGYEAWLDGAPVYRFTLYGLSDSAAS